MAKAKTILNSKDLILLLLFVPGFRGEQCESISGRTRITKMVFLFEKEVWPKFKFNELIDQTTLPDFRAYHFGPFSTDVYADIDFLKNLRLIEVLRAPSDVANEEEALEYQWWLQEVDMAEDEPADFSPERFQITPIGAAFVEQRLRPKLSDQQVEALAGLKARCTGVSLRALLRYVYSKYESYASNSKIRDEILDRRADDTNAF